MQTKKRQWVLTAIFFIVLGSIFLFSQKNTAVVLLNVLGPLAIFQGILCLWVGTKNYQNSILKFSLSLSVIAITVSLVGPYILAALLQEAGVESSMYIFTLIPLAFVSTVIGLLSPKTSQKV